MDAASFLETTAEIAVAFTGFIGIFLVLARRDGRFEPGVRLSIRVIVLSSIGCLFYAAFPLILLVAELAPETVWRLGSGAIVLVGATLTAFVFRSRLRIEGEIPASLAVRTAQVLNGIGLVLAIGNVAGWPWDPSAAVYLASVWLVLGVTAVNFVGLVFERVL